MQASVTTADPTTGSLTGRWAGDNPRSKALAERARRVLPAGVTHDVRRGEPFPLAISRAEGSRKWDLDGHELVCFVMGHGALLLGHRDPAVVEAVRGQASKTLHPGACHELEVEWAESVVDLVPSAELVRFTSSGTEGTLLALRLARAATGRERIVKFEGHFHGWHDQVSFGADAPFDGPDTAGVPSALGGSVTVLAPDPAAVEATLDKGDVAAVIIEPSGAAWGTVPLRDGFLGELRRLTTRAGSVLVFDEVVSGFRWGPGGVQGVSGVTPDLTVLGKILAGGMPGGAVAGGADLLGLLGLPADDKRRVGHPGTHNAHPLSAAAGLVTLAAVRTGEPLARADHLAAQLRAELDGAFERAGITGRVYGEASTFHVLFNHSGPLDHCDTATIKSGGMSRELASELHHGMLLGGVQLFHGSGFVSSVHTESDLERTAEAFASTLRQLAPDLIR